MFTWIANKVAEQLNNRVQKQIDVVLSTHENWLRESRAIDREYRDILWAKEKHEFEVLNLKVDHLISLVNQAIGTNSGPSSSVDQATRAYLANLQASMGQVVESMPEPPASLTGRRRAIQDD